MIGMSIIEVKIPVNSRSFQALTNMGLDVVGVFLLFVEVVVLFAGIVARTIFIHPLIWSTQLAELIFVWLTMVGAVIAVRDNQHMRMTAFVKRLRPTWQARFHAGSDAVQIIASILLVYPSICFFQVEEISSLSQLGISSAWQTAGLIFGFVLIVAYLVRDLRRHKAVHLWYGALGSILLLAAAYGLGLALAPYTLLEVIFVFIGVLSLTVIAGVPIAFAFALCTILYLSVTNSAPLVVISGQIEQGTASIILLAVPLFVLLGGLLTVTRLAPAMMRFLSELFGHVKGGMFYVLIGGIFLVSGISGSKTADLAAVAPIIVPEMKRQNIDEGHIFSVVSSCGAMAETIPPSIVLIIIGAVTGTSISKLFAAGLMPAILLAIILAILARFRVPDQTSIQARTSARKIFRSFLYALPALILPFVIRFSVIDGIATATEVATIGIVYSLILGFVFYGGFSLSALYACAAKAIGLSGAIMFVIAIATAMSWALTQSGFATDITNLMLALPGGQYGFILGTICLMIILGSILEGIPALVLFGPILFPIAATLHIGGVRYGIVVILAMGIGMFAPPIGLGYYATGIISGIDPNAGLKKIWGYLGALVVGLLVVALLPSNIFF